MKYTPAPWKFIRDTLSGDLITDGNQDVAFAIVKSWSGEPDEETRIANGYLMAAAPEMLEALELCYRVFRMDDADTMVSMQVGMAISKAKGEIK